MKTQYAAANSPPPAEGFLPGVANSKLIKHTHHDALRNPELAGVANGMTRICLSLINIDVPMPSYEKNTPQSIAKRH